MTEASAESIYNSGQYASYNPTWGREDSKWKTSQIFKALPKGFIEENFGATGIRVSEVGCGAGGMIGTFIETLKSSGINVSEAVGFDISDKPLRMAREEWGDIEFFNGQITGYEKSFDISLLIDVVEHVPDPDQFVRDAAMRSKYLVLHIPLDVNLNFKVRNRYPWLVEHLGHIHYYNADSALAFLKRNKLSVMKYIYTPGFMLPSSCVHLPAKLGYIPRLILSWISKPICAKVLGGYSLMVLAKSELFKES